MARPERGAGTALQHREPPQDLALERRIQSSLRLGPRERQRRTRWQRWRASLAAGWRSGEIGRRSLLGAPLLAVGFAIWAFGGVYGWAYGLAYLLVFGALAGWCVQCGRGRRQPRWHPTYVPVAAFGLLAVAQYLTGHTAVAASTATALLHLSAAGAVFLLVSQMYRGSRDARWMAACFAVFTMALALLAILQILTASQGIYWHFTYAFASPAGSFVNRNHFAGCMEMLLPISCLAVYWRRHQSWIYLLPWAAAPALGVAAVVLSASRGGIVSLLAQTLAAAVMIAWMARRSGPAANPSDSPAAAQVAGWLPLPVDWAATPPSATAPRRRRHPAPRARTRWAAVLLCLGLTAVLVWAAGSSRLQARLSVADLHAPGVVQRQQLNRSSLAMFRRRPLLGWGLGTWANVYPEFALFTDTSVYAYAHNDYLQSLAETGAAGALCILAVWVVWGFEFWDGVRRRGSRGRAPARAMAVAAALSCLGILIHSWVDFNLHIPANLMLFFIMLALALPDSGESLND